MAPAPVWEGAENLVSNGIRSPDRPARSSVAIPTELSRPSKYLSASLHTDYWPEPHGTAVDTSGFVMTGILKNRYQRR